MLSSNFTLPEIDPLSPRRPFTQFQRKLQGSSAINHRKFAKVSNSPLNVSPRLRAAVFKLRSIFVVLVVADKRAKIMPEFRAATLPKPCRNSGLRSIGVVDKVILSGRRCGETETKRVVGSGRSTGGRSNEKEGRRRVRGWKCNFAA